jgi:hypothetical protein
LYLIILARRRRKRPPQGDMKNGTNYLNGL